MVTKVNIKPTSNTVCCTVMSDYEGKTGCITESRKQVEAGTDEQ